MTYKSPKGMSAFVMVWVGQLFSLTGSAMTGFALQIWVYQKTNSVEAFAAIGIFAFLPLMLFTPIAGVLVDRLNRKLTMALSDMAAGVTTIIIFILLSQDALEFWHLCVIVAFNGIFNAFQWPAYSAAISLMVPKEQFGRANGMISLAETGTMILAPILAGSLLGIIGLNGIILIDFITLAIALLMLLLVTIPNPPKTEESKAGNGNFFREMMFGFVYIFKRPALLGLQLVFLMGNFFASFTQTIWTPMVLARTNENTLLLGTLNSVAAIGGVVGSVILSAWGGPKKKVYGVLVGWFLSGLFGSVLFGMTAYIPIWFAALFLGMAIGPVINGSNQAIWMAKTAPDVQGRVFSARRFIAQISAPLAMWMAGFLADKAFEPGIQQSGSLLNTVFGPIFGTGKGSGMALLMVISGLLVMIVPLVGFMIKPIRKVETILPDQVFEPQPVAETESSG